MNVLIVEDDASNRKVLAKVLKWAGYSVHAAANGIEGFRALRERSYSVIVCDIRMPYLGGKSFFEQVEELFPYMASRVVFVTAWSDEPNTRKFLEQTGQPFLAKPYEIDELVSAVASIAQRTP